MVLSTDSTVTCETQTGDSMATFCPLSHSHSQHVAMKRRSFMVTDILTDRARSSSPGTTGVVRDRTTNQSYNIVSYPFELPTTSPEPHSGSSLVEPEAHGPHSPIDLVTVNSSDKPMSYENCVKRPRTINTSSHTLANSGGSGDANLLDSPETRPIHSPHSLSNSSNDSEVHTSNGFGTDRGASVKSFGARYASGLKTGKKLRKARTAFTDQQLNELEHSFDRQKYLAVQDRMELAARLGLSDMQVKTWYQNRRTKWKRQTAVGLELLAEADNFVAVQRLLQQSTYWAYHPAAQCILGNGELLNRSNLNSTSSESDLILGSQKQTDVYKNVDGTSPPLSKSLRSSASSPTIPNSRDADRENQSISPALLNLVSPQLSGTLANPVITTSTFAGGLPVHSHTPETGQTCASTHMVNPIDLFWLSNWLTQFKSTRPRLNENGDTQGSTDQSEHVLSTLTSEHNGIQTAKNDGT